MSIARLTHGLDQFGHAHGAIFRQQSPDHTGGMADLQNEIIFRCRGHQTTSLKGNQVKERTNTRLEKL
jgi:hypothetical protein